MMETLVIQADQSNQESPVMLNVNRSRKVNDELRGRRNLLKDEVTKIADAIKKGSRYPVRDECMLWMAWYHGLRVSELVNVQWQHVDLKTGQIAVKRRKGSISNTHVLFDKRLRMLLSKLHKEAGKPNIGYVFINERGTPVKVNAFQSAFAKWSVKALGVRWNPHGLRHGTATSMIEAGHDIRTVQLWMGHADVKSTQEYLHESARQFMDVRF